MAGGLFALLDDVAVLAKAAAASVDDIGAAASRASVKATGVIVDDTAVTPRYVHGLAAEREVPIIAKIAKGSLRNKLLFILPAALLLSQFLPGALTPLLMIGGAYLSYEGVEKIWEHVSGHAEEEEDNSGVDEDTIVGSAVRTDFILSAEIMVISLNEVAEEPFVLRAMTLAIVAVVITVLVYGVVALIVKMDDFGLRLAEGGASFKQKIGNGLVTGMPKLLSTLSIVGIAAMIWVGGHILLVGLDELGLHAPYSWVHHLEESVHEVAGVGGILAWLINTIGSAILGLIVGTVVLLLMHLVPRRGTEHDSDADQGDEHSDDADEPVT